MRIPIFLIPPMLATMLLGSLGNACAQTPETVAGRILSVHCEAFLTRGGSRDGYSLQTPRDIGLGLAAGDNVHCKGTGYLEILVAEGRKQITYTLSLHDALPI